LTAGLDASDDFRWNGSLDYGAYNAYILADGAVVLAKGQIL
jgi:hypothetical protein